MPKAKPKLTINLNLLKPQGNPEQLPVKFFRWLLSAGRYIFVLIEAIVLIAFGARFKLDADLASNKESIEEQIPYIESLKPYEILIRQTQLKLSTIDNIKRDSLDGSAILKKIADQTPTSVKVVSINIAKNMENTTVHITGQTQINGDLSNFITGLRGDETFTNVTIASIGLDQGIIKFTINTSANLTNLEGKNI